MTSDINNGHGWSSRNRLESGLNEQPIPERETPMATTGKRIKDPAKSLAHILNEEFKIPIGNYQIDPKAIETLIRDRWDELSFYAHALHDNLNDGRDVVRRTPKSVG